MLLLGSTLLGFTMETTYSRDGALEAPRMSQTVETVEYTRNDIKSLIRALSGESSEVLIAIAEAESGLENVIGVTGDMGVFQFSPITWKDVCSGDAMNIKDNIQCAVNLIEDGQYWRWRASMYNRKNYQGWYNRLSRETQHEINILCDCMTGLRNMGVFFNGRAKDLPTSDRPSIGSVAKFYYKKLGTYHGAKIIKFTKKGFMVLDTNYKPCQKTYREVLWSNTSLLGFWNPK